jgi:hypothetical protein
VREFGPHGAGGGKHGLAPPPPPLTLVFRVSLRHGAVRLTLS